MSNGNQSIHTYRIIEDERTEDINEPEPKNPRRKGRGKRLAFWCIFVSAVFILTDVVLLLFFGKIWFVNPAKKVYKRMGITVSSAQGEINWTAISKQTIDFAFVRATEGEMLTDKQFKTNYDDAYDAGIEVSPMHDLTFTSDGKAQAEAFIGAVGEFKERQLPCSVRVRLYGKYTVTPPDRNEVVTILRDFSDTIYSTYGSRPIIIVNTKLYEDYIHGAVNDSPLCIESIYSKPEIDDKNAVFWLFNPRFTIEGCSDGGYIDKVTILVSEEEYGKLLVTK